MANRKPSKADTAKWGEPTRIRPYHFQMPETILELKLPGTLPIPFQDLVEFRAFMQQCLNRAGVGNLRYGPPAVRKKYMTRIRKEFRAYTKTGNAEHLFNIAVYCWLETVQPQHRNQHWDDTAESATRGEMGGNIT